MQAGETLETGIDYRLFDRHMTGKPGGFVMLVAAGR
jgi:hypothetical protein